MASDTYDADALGPLGPNGAAADQGAAAGRPLSDDDTETAEDEAARVITDIDTLQRERDDLLEMSQRLQADFENYRKRVLREQTMLVERASEGLVEQLLPVLDSFELALANLPGPNAEESDDTGGVRKGIELVHAELLGVLERAGLEPIRALGAPFDPNEHEAVMHDDGDGEPKVGDVLRTGWRLKGRVLRPAMVKVVR
jgi:molecular chaperone GrpE